VALALTRSQPVDVDPPSPTALSPSLPAPWTPGNCLPMATSRRPHRPQRPTPTCAPPLPPPAPATALCPSLTSGSSSRGTVLFLSLPSSAREVGKLILDARDCRLCRGVQSDASHVPRRPRPDEFVPLGRVGRGREVTLRMTDRTPPLRPSSCLHRSADHRLGAQRSVCDACLGWPGACADGLCALSASPSQYSWVGTSYLLLTTTLTPCYGRLSDLLGRKYVTEERKTWARGSPAADLVRFLPQSHLVLLVRRRGADRRSTTDADLFPCRLGSPCSRSLPPCVLFRRRRLSCDARLLTQRANTHPPPQFCGAAQNIEWLIAARAFQGVGGGGIMSMVTVCIGDVVPFGERGSEFEQLLPSWFQKLTFCSTLLRPAEYQGYVGGIWGVASVLGCVVTCSPRLTFPLLFPDSPRRQPDPWRSAHRPRQLAMVLLHVNLQPFYLA